MAGRTAEKTCQVLLQRLQRGQDDLRRSLEQLQPRKQVSIKYLHLYSMAYHGYFRYMYSHLFSLSRGAVLDY